MKHTNSLICIIAFSCLLASCKKNDSSNDTPNDFGQGIGGCRLKALSSPGPGGVFHTSIITYNDAGKPTRVLSPNGLVYDKTYFYSGNRIVIANADSANALYYSDTIFVDDAFRIKSRTYYRGGPTPAGHYIYHYGTDGYLQTRENIPGDGSPGTTNYYSWQNGDLIKDSTDGNEVIYDYDLSKTWQVADRLIDYLDNAGSDPKSKHLNTGFKYRNPFAPIYTIVKRKYSFDNKGRITADSTGLNGEMGTYEYECL